MDNHPECFVYLLVHKTKSRFKIGKATDIRARARGVGQPFDAARSVGLRVANAREAFDLEGILHKSFKRWRIDPLLIIEEDGQTSGFTEWFSLEGWDRARRFLVENVELLGCTMIEPLTDMFAPTPRPRGTLAPIARPLRNDPAADAAAFAACAARCGPLLLELTSVCTCEVVALKHEGELRGEAPADAGVDDLLAALLDASQYEVGWGAGRAFPSYRLQTSRNVVFALKCDFYIGGLTDRRYGPLQEAFLALPVGIAGWSECADLVVPREVFIVPRTASRRWIAAAG